MDSAKRSTLKAMFSLHAEKHPRFTIVVVGWKIGFELNSKSFCEENERLRQWLQLPTCGLVQLGYVVLADNSPAVETMGLGSSIERIEVFAYSESADDSLGEFLDACEIVAAELPDHPRGANGQRRWLCRVVAKAFQSGTWNHCPGHANSLYRVIPGRPAHMAMLAIDDVQEASLVQSFLDLHIDGNTVTRNGKTIELNGNELRWLKLYHAAGPGGLSRDEALRKVFPDVPSDNAWDKTKGRISPKLSIIGLGMKKISKSVWALAEKPDAKPV